MRFGAKLTTVIAALFLLTFLATTAFAVPQAINYQGYIEGPGGVPVNSTVSMTFAIYNTPSGGVALWTETHASVVVTDGVFSVALGSLTPITLSFDEQYYLGVNVSGDGEMSPRAVLVSVPYAMRASDADMVDGQHSSEIIDAASDEVRTPISSYPFMIYTPGSYYLTGDLNVVSTTESGIMVYADNVTIDLGGFMINGPGSGIGRGIYIVGRQNVEVRNGTIRGFGHAGIYESSTAGKGHRVINVRVNYNGNAGIYLSGYDGNHLVKGSMAMGNALYGIYVYNGSTVTGNVVAENGGIHGLYAGAGSTVVGNTAYKNSGNGISAGSGSTVKDNTAYLNQNYGILGAGNCLVDGNTAYDNGTANILCPGCTIINNHAP